jgi:hypothetical protein
MKPSLNLMKESFKKISRKMGISLLVFIMLFSFLITPFHEAKAQGAPVMDAISITWEGTDTIWQKITNTLAIVWKKAGSVAFQQVVRTSLNKIAYDTANYLGSGGKGQKPLFITKDWGSYLTQVGDEALGSFIEKFSTNLQSTYSAECQSAYQTCADGIKNSADGCRIQSNDDQAEITVCDDEEANGINACKEQAVACSEKPSTTNNASSTKTVETDYSKTSSFNVCQPSITAKLRISMGLVEQTRPTTPNCTASKMVQNWGDEAQKLTDFQSPTFLQDFKDIFNPVSNDLGIYFTAQSDLTDAKVKVSETAKTDLTANKGWLGVTNIAKSAIGVPGAAEAQRDKSGDLLNEGLGKVTGDIVVDAAMVFLNQFAITGFNTLMANLGKKVSGNNSDLTNSQVDVSVDYGEGKLQEITSSIIKPNFGVRADYDILNSLSMCPDAKNPGPTDCVIDNKLMQAISDKKTVAEAIADGSLNGSWQLTKDTIDGAYSLRNIQILIKYRILPVGWEQAINLAYADPSHPIKVTLMDLVSSFDGDGGDSYNQFSAGFNNQGTFKGLVDPNWVLKAPLNYCKKEGVGSQLTSKTTIPSTPSSDGSQYIPSVLNVTRAESYCADEQSCIKEKADGSCEAYGYCNEEQRTWNFSSDSCNPVYNTCRSFTNSSSGQNVSYLENTLNYKDCDANSAGCRQYSVFGPYSTTTNSVSWDNAQSIYFNKNVASCSSQDEGCTELIRVKPTWGANLVMDADFNNEEIGYSSTDINKLKDWPINHSTSPTSLQASIVDAPGGASGKALSLKATGCSSAGIYSNSANSLLPANFEVITGSAYTVSADVYIAIGSKATIYLGDINDTTYTQSTTVANDWQHLTVTRDASIAYTEPSFGITAFGNNNGNNLTVYIKNVKFEVSNFENSFDVYGAYKFYQKLIPPYLENTCYLATNGADYRLRSDAPAICNNFARKCNKSEVGCELFTGSNGLTVSGQVTSSDYCPQECVGYDVYVSKQNNFNSAQAENLIPTSAKTCNAADVGCSEFTNLDSISQGGENKEYYSALKSCIKPSPTDCSSFYSWEGTANGYQLRSYSLQKDTATNGPEVTADDKTLCNAAIYNKTLFDSEYNPDCHEFYNSAGQVFYHLTARTITCSDNCHAYRMSDINTDATMAQKDCTPANNAFWDTNVCDVCLNGGTMKSDQTSTGAKAYCVYQAIPGEGKTCSAAQAGCSEYNGNNGNNTKIISSFDFESGIQGWFSNGSNPISVSTISNNKDGHSLYVPSGSLAQFDVGSLVEAGKSYSLRFIAKTDAPTNANVQIYFSDNDPANPKKANFSTSSLAIKGGGEWNIYQTNLSNLDHAITVNEILAITANGNFYFDDVVLTEITDRYYLIKGSSVIPDICSFGIFNNFVGLDQNLGCAQYTDRNNLIHNLSKFSKLCSSSSVGCEQMIATQNYTPYSGHVWTDNNGISVKGDTAIYAVYDSSKLCNSKDMGCSRVGQSLAGGGWSDVYKANNPNKYDTTLCEQSKVGCEAWTADTGTLNYFRDPGTNACQYRNGKASSTKAWYLIPAKRCVNKTPTVTPNVPPNPGKVCSADADCSSNASSSCIIDNNDYLCVTTNLKTFGLGGAGNQVPTPDQSAGLPYAGLCDAANSGCTEYIDPVSKPSPNLIIDDDGIYHNQLINLDPNKVYILSASGGTTPPLLTFDSGVRELQDDNNIATKTSVTTITAQLGTNKIFASLGNNGATLSTGSEPGKKLSLKEAIINYQLQDNIDKTSCNGQVNENNGCILFNERSMNGASGLISLTGGFDAFKSSNNAAPVPCGAPGSCNTNNTNQLIKVSPNRVCSKWLDCVTYVQDPLTKARTCYAVGQCTSLNDKNECANFETSSTDTVDFKAGAYNNSTGYTLLNKYQLGNMTEVGYDSDVHFDFENSIPALSCRNAKTDGVCSFKKNIVTDLLVREPANSPTDYPAHGISYLKVPNGYIVSPQLADSWISVASNTTYYLNFLVNTKNSGSDARVSIINKASQTLTSLDSTSDTWSRQILPFYTGSATSVKIELSAKDSTSSGAVYFDDLNIEPVLKVGNIAGKDQYVSRECRLYPTGDSLTCVNKNKNVIKDGLEGYCLEHDPSNKDVCLMWYPVDNISATQLNRTSSGYQGQFPLDYCTEVNGNFDLVKKVTFAPVYFDAVGNDATFTVTGDMCYKYNISTKSWNHTGDNWNIGVSANIHLSLAEQQKEFEDKFLTNKALSLCKPPYYPLVNIVQVKNVLDSPIKIACVPDDSSLLPGLENNLKYPSNMGSCNSIGYHDGFVRYDGKLSDIPYVISDSNTSINAHIYYTDAVGINIYPYPATGESVCREYADNSVSDEWCTGNFKGLDESTNIDGSVRVLDYNNPPADEEGLKLISGNDADKTFRLTCNNFMETVNSNGDNMAWAARTNLSSIWSTSTPPFFVDNMASSTSSGGVTNKLAFYGAQEILLKKIVGTPIAILDNTDKSGKNFCAVYSNKKATTTVTFNPANAAWPDWLKTPNNYNSYCDNNYKTVMALNSDPGYTKFIKIMCVPDETLNSDGTSNLLVKTGQTIGKPDPGQAGAEAIVMGACSAQGSEYQYFDGWVKYDGILKKQPFVSNNSAYCSADPSDAWCIEYKGIDETSNINLGVYNLLKYDFLKALPATSSDLVSGSAHSLAAYGNNRETNPFGAATWPDSLSLFNSNAITFRNQFSKKNNEDTFAGRPYGCSNYNTSDKGKGCENIGYCSLDPSVYCLTKQTNLVSDPYVSKKTCADGGYGTCVPLWSNYLGKPDDSKNTPPADYQNILKTLFLKSYGAYSFQNGTYVNGTASSSDLTKMPSCPISGRPNPKCDNMASNLAYFCNASSSADSFCYVNPKISGVSAFPADQTISGSGITKGIWGLKFNTTIDPEQQPLKEIKINWEGNDSATSTQVITGQDSHPSLSDPHIFYHYYQTTASRTIKITITDNWGHTSTFP